MSDLDDLAISLAHQESGDGSAPLKAYHILIDVAFDLDREETIVTSWGLTGFRVVGRDMFALFKNLPSEIATWFHNRYGVEVVVVPMTSTTLPSQRRMSDGYVAMTVRSILAEAARLSPDAG